MRDEWEIEMDRILDVFEHESETSLWKINERFVALDRPFNDEFRQYFMKMTAHRYWSRFYLLWRRQNQSSYISDGIFRLDMSFTKIEMKRWNKSQAKSNNSGSTSNPERDRQNDAVQSNSGPSTIGRTIATIARLRKHLNLRIEKRFIYSFTFTMLVVIFCTYSTTC